MTGKPRLVFIAGVAAVGEALPGFAQSSLKAENAAHQSGHRIAASPSGLHDVATISRAPLPLDPNEPMLTG